MLPILARRMAALALLCVCSGAAAADREPVAPEFPRAFDCACRSVVRVEATLDASGVSVRTVQAEEVFANSGVFVSTDGLVLTSVLGLAGCKDLKVVCADGRESAAEMLAYDQGCGLALLKTGLADTEPLIPVAGPPAVGSWVLLAAPAARESGIAVVLIPGFVSRLGADVRLNGLSWDGLTVATVNARPGSAAAPLLDPEGRLVGLVIGSAPTGTMAAIGGDCYVLPPAGLEPVLARLRNGEFRRLGWLGIAVATERGRDDGLLVKAVLRNSPAEEAGIRRGDVLLQVGEQLMKDVQSMSAAVIEPGPGRRLEVTVLREGDLLRLSVTTQARPILICGGVRRAGEKAFRMRWPGAFGFPPRPGGHAQLPDGIAELLEENRQLQERLADAEARLRGAERD